MARTSHELSIGWYIIEPNIVGHYCSLGIKLPHFYNQSLYLGVRIQLWIVVAVGSSGILKVKQKLGVTFNFDKQDVVDFTKFSKMTMCRASEANS